MYVSIECSLAKHELTPETISIWMYATRFINKIYPKQRVSKLQDYHKKDDSARLAPISNGQFTNAFNYYDNTHVLSSSQCFFMCSGFFSSFRVSIDILVVMMSELGGTG